MHAPETPDAVKLSKHIRGFRKQIGRTRTSPKYFYFGHDLVIAKTQAWHKMRQWDSRPTRVTCWEQLEKIQGARVQQVNETGVIKPNSIVCGKAHDLVQRLPDKSVNLVITSPPYAEQRKNYYDGVPESEYPYWFADLMKRLYPKLKTDGSVFVIIREHLSEGEISDYVLRTRLAIRLTKWREAEKLIWLKRDAPPLASHYRPRRNYEEILWYAKKENPFANLTACGRDSTRIGFEGQHRFGLGHNKPIHGGQTQRKNGTSRISDVIESLCGSIPPGIPHTAMFPPTLADTLIKTFSRAGDVVLDCFSGSGTTAICARDLDRKFIGFDSNQQFVDLALARLAGTFVPENDNPKMPNDNPKMPRDHRRTKLYKDRKAGRVPDENPEGD